LRDKFSRKQPFFYLDFYLNLPSKAGITKITEKEYSISNWRCCILRNRFLFILCLLLVLSSSVFATTITLWTWYDGIFGAIFRQLVKEDFVAKTGIDVEILSVPIPDMFNKLLLAYLGGDAPDVVELYTNQVVELGVRGALMDLSRFKDLPNVLDGLYPNYLKQLTYHNSTFALPCEIAFPWTYIRQDMFNDMGLEIPKTWDDFKVISTKLKARGLGTYYDHTGDAGTVVASKFLALVYQRGTDIYTPDGKGSNLAAPEVISAFKEFTSLYKDHGLLVEDPIITTFASGETPITIMQAWYYYVFENTAPQINGKWTVAEIPGTKQKDGSINHNCNSNGLSWSIVNSTKKADAAWEFMKWLSTPAFTEKFSKRLFESQEKARIYFATKGFLDQAPFPADHKAVAQKALQACRQPTAIVGGYVADRYIDFAFNKVYLQNADPEVAIKQAAKDSTDEIQRKLKEFARFLNK